MKPNPAFLPLFALIDAGAGVAPTAREHGISRETLRSAYKRYKSTPGAQSVARPAAADEWTLPSAGKIAPAIVEKRAPAHGGKWSRFIAAADVHGDMQDKETCDVLWRFMDSWKPRILCCLGDVWDWRPMRNGASNEEKSESMNLDFQMGRAWLERFFAGEGEKYLTLGNHDARPYEWAENRRGVERDFAAGKVQIIEDLFSELRINWVPYHKRKGVIKIGHLRLIHGFHCGIYAARQAALIYGSVLMGHTHSIDEHHIPGLERRAARIIGACCNLDMNYNARQPNSLKQANGFAYGVLNQATGDYHVWQAESYGGEWLMPSDVVEL